jgi:hypothetical protein
MLEQAGIGKPSFNAAGHLTGVTIDESLRQVIHLSDSVDAMVVRGVPPQYDRQHEQPPLTEPVADHG